MHIIKLRWLTIAFLMISPLFIFCSNKEDKVSSSSQVRCDGFYYCIRPDNNNLMMIIQFYNDGKLRASQWIHRDGTIGEIADVKNAADSWLKVCEGFTMCTSYHVGGIKIEFELDFAGPEKVFAIGGPVRRSFAGKMLHDGRLSCTWDHDDTHFLFNFISNSNRQPTRSDSLTT